VTLALILTPTLVYVIAAGWCWRRFAWRIAWKEASQWSHPGRIDGGNVTMGLVFGGLQALVWPFVLFAMRGVRTEAFYGFLAEPRGARRKREENERDKRIAELEREVGIR